MTELRGGVDSTTVLNLLATLAPVAAMVAVLGHPAIRPEVRRSATFITCAWAAAAVAVTILKHVAGSVPFTQRLDTFAFGTAPDTGEALAPLLLLVGVVSGSRIGRGATVAVLAGGLLLSQARGAILAFIAALAVISFGIPRLRLYAAAASAAMLGIFALAFSRSLTFSDNATRFRGENLTRHWHLFLRKPVFGYGISAMSLDDLQAAHNSLLSIGWPAGWLRLFSGSRHGFSPRFGASARGCHIAPANFALGAVVATFVGWLTTGGEILLYSPPTNLLPIVLATSIIGSPLLEDEVATDDGGSLRDRA